MSKTIALIGEVLFDLYPNQKRILGGAPFNVAWHLQAFGAVPDFISRIGTDALGVEVRNAMLAIGMNFEHLQTDVTHPTGQVSVYYEQDEPRYRIEANQAYDYIDARPLVNRRYDIIYHGSLALRHAVSEQALATLLANHHGLRFIDVNLRAPWWQLSTIQSLIQQADWLKLNQEEVTLLVPNYASLNARIDYLFAQSQKLNTLIVTRGAAGAIAVNRAGDYINVAPKHRLPVVDTVGAGDAFAAVILLAMQRGWSLADMMARAQQFAGALVKIQGATVQDLSFYQAFIDEWQL